MSEQETIETIHPARLFDFPTIFAGLQKNVEEGLIRCSYGKGDLKDLAIYTYTELCTKKKAWDLFTLMARGLILDVVNCRVIATPFLKFFNYGERGYKIPDLPFETTEKMDGSLGIIYFYNGKWRVATKGSLDSEQSRWATKYLRKNISLNHLNEGFTYLAEIIYPEDRKVVRYEKQGLFLLGVYDDKGYEVTEQYRHLYFLGFGSVKVLNKNSVEELLEIAKEMSENEEGFVVRFSNGTRIKIKGDKYCRAHAIISACTPLSIWNAMLYDEDLEKLREVLPEEFFVDFDKILEILNEKKNNLLKDILEHCAYVKGLGLSNKEIGLRKDLNKLYIFETINGTFDQKFSKIGSVFRKGFFDNFRPLFNVLEGYTPTSAMNRFSEAS